MRTPFSSLFVFTIASFIAVFLVAPVAQGEQGPRVVTTTGMITDIVKQVGGEGLSVRGLIGPGVDPHLYKATRSDIAALTQANIVFYNGLLLEGKMTDALIKVASAGGKVYAVTEQIGKEYLLEPEGFAGHFDPHVWMDPQAWGKAVEVVEKKLSSYTPTMKPIYSSNKTAYLDQLASLDQYAEKALNSVPKTSRVLVTAHDAFNYFGKRYGFEVVGIQGISTESEAGVKDIEHLVDLLVTRSVQAVFVESTVSQRNINALVEGALAKGHTVSIGGELFSDAMGKPGTYEGTYIGMIDHNVTTIVRALGGQAPEKGFQGKLR
ncbi:MAG: zinc ABC transporter substrate-binding protein [Bdellovibrionales bacterium]|nr:zinc ABC transporter substrate-binding protein [Bdellovibrionales bacterium]